MKTKGDNMAERNRGRPERFLDPDDEEVYIIHPDVTEWSANYRPGKSFKEIVDKRNQVTDHEGYVHHNPDYDQAMLDHADEATRIHAAKGNKWPEKRKKR